MPKKLFVLLSILFISFTSLNAQTVFGKYAGEFMAIGVSGRALGMGSAFVGVADDVTSGYYNPAGLANLNYPQISLMHTEQFGNLVNYDYAAVGIPFGTDMSFGLSVMRLGVDGIPDTRNALIDGQTGALINDINNIYARLDYSKITEFSNQDWAFYLTFAKKISDKFILLKNSTDKISVVIILITDILPQATSLYTRSSRFVRKYSDARMYTINKTFRIE